MSELINVTIVDDHKIFRKAMVRLLKTFARVGEVQEAENGLKCIDGMKEKQPDVVLLDLEMPVMNGMECAEKILEKYKDVKIIVLTMHDSAHYIAHFIEIGVHSFLLKNTDPEELEQAIYSVYDKDFYHNELIASVVKRMVKEKFNKNRLHFSVLQSLTAREREILIMLCNEESMKTIATKLSLSEKTVQSHKLNLQEKLGVKTTVGLVKLAYEAGLIQ